MFVALDFSAHVDLIGSVSSLWIDSATERPTELVRSFTVVPKLRC
jgi:hypothetical protein